MLSEELDRNFTALKQKADPAPYFMSYAVTDEDYSVVSASFGAITSRNQSRNASLDVIEASARAYLQAMNKLLYYGTRRSETERVSAQGI